MFELVPRLESQVQGLWEYADVLKRSWRARDAAMSISRVAFVFVEHSMIGLIEAYV